MAIARDATSASGVAFNTSSVSWEHTVTGSDTALVAVNIGEPGGDGSFITGATYADVAMTLKGSIPVLGDRWIYVWYLASPADGTHTLTVFGATGTYALAGVAASYTGVRAVDSSSTFATVTPSTTVAFTHTNLAAALLVTGFGLDFGATLSDGVLGHLVVRDRLLVMDSLSAVAAGPHTVDCTADVSVQYAGVTLALLPTITRRQSSWIVRPPARHRARWLRGT